MSETKRFSRHYSFVLCACTTPTRASFNVPTLVPPKIPGVDEVFRFVGDVSNLMTFRLWCFSSLDITIPTLFLDTDMLCVGSVDPAQAIQDADVAVCAREFGCQDIINTSFREMDLSEYSGKTFGEVYPYVACATVTRSSKFWKDCLQNLRQLHPKFHFGMATKKRFGMLLTVAPTG